jgi:hypothetical protein
MMKLRQLRYFVTIVDAGSFSRAAQVAHVAQPALSQQIADLEDQLGVTLLQRSAREPPFAGCVRVPLFDRRLFLVRRANGSVRPGSIKKDAGINRLTFDVFFLSKDAYEAALRSNLFCARNVADELGFELACVVGAYFVDNCNAIKITVERPIISASPGERDVFGAQQQSMLERMVVPIYSDAL